MARNQITSRYVNSGLVLDDGLLREGRLTAYLTDPPTLEFVDLPDNTRIKVRNYDRLDSIATAFYGDPNLWWVIAAFQEVPIMNPLYLEPGRELVIPSQSYVFSEILKRTT